MGRRLFGKSPDMLLVDEDLPLINLPPPTASFVDLEDDDDDDDMLFAMGDGEAPTEEFHEASSPLRVFVGSPQVKTSAEREHLAASVTGPVWDATSLASRRPHPQAHRPVSPSPMARLGERSLKDALAEAAAALDDGPLGAAVTVGPPRAHVGPRLAMPGGASSAKPPVPGILGGPKPLVPPKVTTTSSGGWGEVSADSWKPSALEDDWDNVADDDSWDAGAFGDERSPDEISGPRDSLSLELPPLVVPRERLHDATIVAPMDLPTEPPRGLLDDDPSLPIEAFEGDPAEADSELSLPPRAAADALLSYGDPALTGSRRTVLDDDYSDLPESDDYSWEMDERGGLSDESTGVPLGVPRGSRLAGVRAASTPGQRPARAMPSFEPSRAIGRGPLVLMAALLLVAGLGWVGWSQGLFNGLLPGVASTGVGEVAKDDQASELPAEEVEELPKDVPVDPELWEEFTEVAQEATGATTPTPSVRPTEQGGGSEGVQPREAVDSGRLIVRSTQRATIYVNGKRYGQTPMDPLNLPAGTYLVRAISVSTGKVKTTEARVDVGGAREVRFSF